MKETYYKLNREKLARRAYWLTILQDEGILEEVQEEEEMTPEEAEKKLDEMQGLLESMKGESPVKTATEQAIDNMFGNPLGQVDNMIEGTKVYELNRFTDYDLIKLISAGESDDRKELKEAARIELKKRSESKPFLDGMKPSEWLKYEYEISPMFEKTSGVAQRLVIGKMLDLGTLQGVKVEYATAKERNKTFYKIGEDLWYQYQDGGEMYSPEDSYEYENITAIHPIPLQPKLLEVGTRVKIIDGELKGKVGVVEGHREFTDYVINLGVEWRVFVSIFQVVPESLLVEEEEMPEWEKEFEQTRLAKEGGSSFECSDYEGIYDDMKEFIRKLLNKQAIK